MRIQKVNLSELSQPGVLWVPTPLDPQSNWSYGKGGDGLWFISYTDDKCLKQQQFVFPKFLSELFDEVEGRAFSRGKTYIRQAIQEALDCKILFPNPRPPEPHGESDAH